MKMCLPIEVLRWWVKGSERNTQREFGLGLAWSEMAW